MKVCRIFVNEVKGLSIHKVFRVNPIDFEVNQDNHISISLGAKEFLEYLKFFLSYCFLHN